jgi:hypothetical protein
MKKLTLILLLTSFTFFGQKKVDQTELMKSLTISNENHNKLSVTLWIPNSYWRIVLEGSPDVPEESISLLEKTFDNYLLICSVDIEIGSGASMDFKSKPELQKIISITDINNKVYKPLPDSEINYDAKNLLKNMSPMFAQMFGEMGKGMHFFLFIIKNDKGENIINEFEKGEFTVGYSDNKFKWTLPLSALIDKKYCPIDKMEMNGNWNYCPFHGIELKDK